MNYIIKIGKYYFVKDYRFYSSTGEIALLTTDKAKDALLWDEPADDTANSLAEMIGGRVIPVI
ncbi:hypothetical protein EUA41_13550 [Bacillus velezensis]|uniref:hypothetical protein n=1 Tax=Bacillus velezensis TaxID=492670 RepID=UPI0011ABDD95|nr:hypothetical protein [Bacillus velezensis]TWO93416.1 hypothetical protein EUA41_13550 [Bacillus velezensis]